MRILEELYYEFGQTEFRNIWLKLMFIELRSDISKNIGSEIEELLDTKNVNTTI
jgi:hypothetical protein